MALIDTQELLEPVSESQPTGENLEYQPDFAALERAAEGKPARQMGSSIVPGEPPNSARVLELGSELLRRSKDLRIATRLARASLDRGSFAGFAEGLALIRGLLERYWQELHPELDPDDGDATMRIAALAALNAPELLTALRTAPLLISPRFGPISLRDIAVAAGEVPPPSEPVELDADVIAACFREADIGELEVLLQSLEAARADAAAIVSLLELKARMAPDLAALDRLLYQARVIVKGHVDARPSASAPRASAPGASAPRASAPRAVALDTEAPPLVSPDTGAALVAGAVAAPRREPEPRGIRDRADVVRSLDEICEYYARHEPSSPLPLLLRRCRRLVPLSFLEIVEDLAPDALSQIQLIAGKTEE